MYRNTDPLDKSGLEEDYPDEYETFHDQFPRMEAQQPPPHPLANMHVYRTFVCITHSPLPTLASPPTINSNDQENKLQPTILLPITNTCNTLAGFRQEICNAISNNLFELGDQIALFSRRNGVPQQDVGTLEIQACVSWVRSQDGRVLDPHTVINNDASLIVALDFLGREGEKHALGVFIGVQKWNSGG